MSFPYPLPPLDLSAPLDRRRDTARLEWIDPNGHMNVGYYLFAFDLATDEFCHLLWVDWDYTRHKLGLSFVQNAHFTYDHEVRAGGPLRFASQLLDHD